jgi:hypothetical protein
MIVRDIIKNSVKIGELSFEDGTSEELIEAALSAYVEPPSNADSYLNFTIKQRKEFADLLLEKFKLRNIKDGINALQGMHMHHLLRAYPVSFMGQSFVIDIMNLAISGDLEIACLCLMYGATDDMSESYHWLSADRKSYLISEIKGCIGWS